MNIEIKNLVKDYGRTRAIAGISLNISQGMFGLLGPNGAGKTTLMRILTTQLLPTSGGVTVDGINVVQSPVWLRQRLGYLPQDFGFYHSLTGYETLDYIGILKGLSAADRRQQVEAVLEQVNLTSHARSRVGGFSGGMKQRLGIAQALLGDPSLLVVDEPTSGLDPEERIRLRNLLSRISRHRTVVLSTHIVGDVESSCSGLAVLRQGQILFAGLADELTNIARNQVWLLEVSFSEWERAAPSWRIISSRRVGGGMQVRVLSDTSPLGRGVAQEPTLEDGYMVLNAGFLSREGLGGV